MDNKNFINMIIFVYPLLLFSHLNVLYDYINIGYIYIFNSDFFHL